ncbi:MAG TPA: transporter substrate-binding domain-containing protein, partial [Chloroflexi bacterium]|nr:transporter substrate-binding domain-containing protein [Chloroflexota bacterium]
MTDDEQVNDNKYNLIIIILAVVFAIVLAFFAWFVFKSFFGSGPGSPGGSGDAVWDRIQSSGKMVVGTSADYPPFEYYDNSYQLDGFDIALIRDIGQQIGVEVEIRDMVFDDLNNALQLGQIDVAIAALTV